VALLPFIYFFVLNAFMMPVTKQQSFLIPIFTIAFAFGAHLCRTD
jgi:hypothetical protein